MKNIIPFKKEIIFDTNISEITSISLENTLSLKDNNLSGDFIISGEYKNNEEIIPFNKKVPFEIIIDDDYDTRETTIDIDDFYYEIKNNNVLFVSIDVLLDKLKKIERIIEEPIVDIPKEENVIDDVFNVNTLNIENYVEYNVYILRENDTIDTVLDKYNTTIDKLKEYNNLDDLKIGDKIIIPSNEGD